MILANTQKNKLDLKDTFLKLLFTLLISVSIKAEESKIGIYNQAVDDINCATTKVMLIGFDRPGAAKSIKSCSYNEIEREVKKVEENLIRGYKTQILGFAANVDQYKNRIENPSEYSLYDAALDELQNYCLNNLQAICKRYQKSTNSVCENLDKKTLVLESDLKDISNDALKRINSSSIKAGSSSKINKKGNVSSKSSIKSEEKKSQPPKKIVSNNVETSSSSSRFGSLFSFLVTLLILGALFWLYKDNRQLREEVEDLKMLLKAFTEN